MEAGNGWNSPSNSARWGTDYLSRAATARSNIYENLPEEIRNFYTDDDSTGQPLSGENSYSITFAKGQLPAEKGFWSLTLYNENHFFYPNAQNRYSLSSRNKTFKTNKDGSLTIYAGSRPPGKSNQANWLPAPNGKFSLFPALLLARSGDTGWHVETTRRVACAVGHSPLKKRGSGSRIRLVSFQTIYAITPQAATPSTPFFLMSLSDLDIIAVAMPRLLRPRWNSPFHTNAQKPLPQQDRLIPRKRSSSFFPAINRDDSGCGRRYCHRQQSIGAV